MSGERLRLWPSALATRWLGQAHRVETTVASTNDLAWSWASSSPPAPHGAVIVAERQTAGRGRQGRRWDSPPGNLYVSVILRPALPLAQLLAWPLVVGVSLAACLETHLRTPRIGLKWPNDLWLDERKFGGILLESRADPIVVVVGIGLNLVEPIGGWGERTDHAHSLAGIGLHLEPADVLNVWLPRLESDWESFVDAGFAPFRPDWIRRSVLQGRRVRVANSDEELEVLGVDTDGALLARGAGGEDRVLRSGEVHLGSPR